MLTYTHKGPGCDSLAISKGILALEHALPSAVTPSGTAATKLSTGAIHTNSKLFKCGDQRNKNLYHWAHDCNHCTQGGLKINSCHSPDSSPRKKVVTVTANHNQITDEVKVTDSLMWEDSHPPVSQCTSAFLLFWRSIYRLWKPTLRTVGQCLFGLAMLFLIAGIALCIWGYLGTAIRPFQIFGPVCIGIGVIVYIIGCLLCCRDYPDYEHNLKESERKEKTRQAIKTLKQKDVIEWMQGEPEIYEEFKQLAVQVLNTHG